MNLRFTYLFFLFVSCSFVASAQLEASKWYFGNNAGLDFSSGTPVPLEDGQLRTDEGCATISDAMGNLLFYTDGTYVWNRNHQIMPNGSGLKGHNTSTQSAIIVPKPNTPNVYYVFTACYQGNPGGINYSEIDMTMDGGLGDVVTKNVPLYSPSMEKLTAVKHANGRDIWVLTHDWYDKGFIVYLVTPSGVNNVPVISTVGMDMSTHFVSARAIGYLKASPNGRKVAISHRDLGSELFDFDAATGKVSNPITLNTKGNQYGVEFSPSSQVLYLSSLYGELYQFDLNAVDIPASATLINNNDQEGALQLAIDGKIYIANYNSHKLGVINDPDVVGVGCNYEYRTVDLGNGISISGLPPFIQSYFFVSDIQVENLCYGETTQFKLNTKEPITSILWDFGDGNTSNLANPTHLYALPGTYTVKVEVVTSTGSDEKTLDINISEIPVANAIPDIEVCKEEGVYEFDLTTMDAVVLATQDPMLYDVAYFENQTDAINNTNPLPKIVTGSNPVQDIYVRVSNSLDYNCFDTTLFEIRAFDSIVEPEVEDWLVCHNQDEGPYIFDLQVKTEEILEGLTGYTVSYYASEQDALLRQNDIGTIYQDLGGLQTIYFRLENSGNTNCFTVGTFQLQVFDAPVAQQPEDWVICDQENMGSYIFDLVILDKAILNGQDPTIFEVRYFSSESNALMNENPISKNEHANSGLVETVYARVHNNARLDCFDVVPFNLVINQLPNLDLEDTYVICPDSPKLTIMAGEFESYLWSNEDGDVIGTERFLEISTLGTYTLLVTETKNGLTCANSKTFEVLSSGAPESFTVTTDGFSDTITLTIDAIGIGSFEYSIDGLSFQTSNQFEVFPGKYTVYVRDSLGCRTLSDEVVAIGYQRFFTPNGDNVNETWNIIGGELYPESQLFIYDRYGKLLVQLSPLSLGWDGRFLGKPMPSSDYWFKYIYDNGKIITGHFSLRR